MARNKQCECGKWHEETGDDCNCCVIDNLKAEVENLTSRLHSAQGLIVDSSAEVKQLRAEVERLKEYIQKADSDVHTLCYENIDLEHQNKVLREAVKSGLFLVSVESIVAPISRDRMIYRKVKTILQQALNETAINEPIEQTSDHHTDLLEHLESTGTPGQLADAIEEAEENV